MTIIVASGKNGKVTEKDKLVGAAVKNFVWCAMTENENFLKGFYGALPELRENRQIQRMVSEMISLQPDGTKASGDECLESIVRLRFELNDIATPIFRKLAQRQLLALSSDGIQAAAGVSLVSENLKEKQNMRLC